MPDATPYVIALTSVLATVFGSKLLADWARDRRRQKKEQGEQHMSNAGKEIDADVTALNLITDRLKTVELRIDNLQEKLSVEMAKNSRLEAENEALRKENERLATRLHGFAEKLTHKDKEILDLRLELQQTRSDLESLRVEFHAGQPQRPNEGK